MKSMSALAKFIVRLPIRFYQLCISPFMAPSCRYTPTCSAYALEAIEKHGAVKGLYLALRRMARCHPWSKDHGHDHVPPIKDNK